MTLKEIAKEANVSISTVSRVINQKNTKAASPEVQERIWNIVRKSGYTPNSTARALKLGPTTPSIEVPARTIAVFMQGEILVSVFSFPILQRPLNKRLLKATFSSNTLSPHWI